MEKTGTTTKKRIALIGPESTAKSTLAEQLSRHYHTVFVPEYAREFISELKRPYTLKDIELISKTQLAQETEALKKATNYLFVDTELIIAKIWCEDIFNDCPLWIKNTITENPYDFYLLTFPDIPWKKDSVRENENRRDYFYNLYLEELKSKNFPYSIVTGSDNKRLLNAIQAIDSFFKK